MASGCLCAASLQMWRPQELFARDVDIVVLLVRVFHLQSDLKHISADHDATEENKTPQEHCIVRSKLGRIQHLETRQRHAWHYLTDSKRTESRVATLVTNR